MPAVLEPAIGRKPLDLGETEAAPLERLYGGREIAHTRRVEQLARRREIVGARRGGGVAALVRAVEGADRRRQTGFGDERGDEGGFADARLADEHAAMPLQRGRERREADAAFGAAGERRVARRPVGLEGEHERLAARQVAFVEHHEARKPR